MSFLFAFLWCAGYLNTTVLLYINNDEEYSTKHVVLCAFLWPLVAVVILYFMLFYRKKP